MRLHPGVGLFLLAAASAPSSAAAAVPGGSSGLLGRPEPVVGFDPSLARSHPPLPPLASSPPLLSAAAAAGDDDDGSRSADPLFLHTSLPPNSAAGFFQRAPLHWCAPPALTGPAADSRAALDGLDGLWLYDCALEALPFDYTHVAGEEEGEEEGEVRCTTDGRRGRKCARVYRGKISHGDMSAVDVGVAERVRQRVADARRHQRSRGEFAQHVRKTLLPLVADVQALAGGHRAEFLRGLASPVEVARLLAHEVNMPDVDHGPWDQARQGELLEWLRETVELLLLRKAFVNQPFFDELTFKGTLYSAREGAVASVHTRELPSHEEERPDGNLVSVAGDDSGDDVLQNFSYLHRCAAALSSGMFADMKTYNKYVAFVHMIRESTASDAYDAQHVKDYFVHAPLQRDLAPEKLFRAMEGNPYAAAYAINYMSQNERVSTSPLFPGKWSAQPLEIDLYLPPGLAAEAEKFLHDGLSSEHFDELVAQQVRVGHAGKVGMGMELSQGCGVTESDLSGVKSFMSLGTWFRSFNTALKYLRDEEVHVSADSIANGDAHPYAFQRLFRDDMKVLLDIKCHFDTSVLDAVVDSINRKYGVVVSGVGSFYQLPELTIQQVSSIAEMSATARLAPPTTYTFFFSPDEAKQGLADRRINKQHNILVGASSLIVRKRKDVDRDSMSTASKLWELLPLTSETEGECIGYEPDTQALETLRQLRDAHGMKLGIWTLEAELGAPALAAINRIANDVDLFPLGFALGGEHNPALWPNKACEPMGGIRSLGVIGKLMKNVRAKKTRSFGLWSTDDDE